MLKPGVVVFTLILIVFSAAAATPAIASSNGEKSYEYYASIYPCTKCHAAMNLTGMSKASSFHKIDLTFDAHKGLYCADCHISPLMIGLRGGTRVYLPGFHNRTLVEETNKLCAECHPQEYNDYVSLVHGNKTYVCPGGRVEKIIGYKNVIYNFHICSNSYRNLTTVPAKACVECHNPHTPTLKPLGVLPKPSERPKPPDETGIAIADIVAVIAFLVPIGFSLASRFR